MTLPRLESRLRSPGLIEVSGQEIRCSPSLMGQP